MISCNLTGNFGNHIWNYVICRIVAEKLNYEWGIYPIPNHDYHNGSSQFYFMDVDYGKEVRVMGKNSRGLNVYEGITNEYYDTPLIYDNSYINMYDPNVFNISDNTMIHLISQSEDYLIERKDDVASWFKIKDDYVNQYQNRLSELGISLDENMCVINFRGGEFRSVPNLIPSPKYWNDSINHMLSINPNMKFIIITDDVQCAQQYVGNYPCYHFDIGFDYYIINQSHYNIISNSSFGWWATWLNQKSNLIIAPKYWGRHNTSNGYWSLGDQYVRKFKYMSREGILEDYERCKNEALEFYKKNNII